MPLIAGLFASSQIAAGALRKLDQDGLEIRVRGHNLAGLERYAGEKQFDHGSVKRGNTVLVVIRSNTVDLVALQERLQAAGMEVLETQYGAPRTYSRYPFGDGIRPDLEEHPVDGDQAGSPAPDRTTSGGPLKRK